MTLVLLRQALESVPAREQSRVLEDRELDALTAWRWVAAGVENE
jgi:hypothetical protein